MEDNGRKTFIRITNKMVYDEIQEMHKTVKDVYVKQKLINEKLSWHNKLFYSTGTVFLAMSGWLFYLSIHIGR